MNINFVIGFVRARNINYGDGIIHIVNALKLGICHTFHCASAFHYKKMNIIEDGYETNNSENENMDIVTFRMMSDKHDS